MLQVKPYEEMSEEGSSDYMHEADVVALLLLLINPYPLRSTEYLAINCSVLLLVNAHDLG